MVATAEVPFRVAEATVALSSRKVTVPVAVKLLTEVDASVAVTSIVLFATGVMLAGVTVRVVVALPTITAVAEEVAAL